MFIIIQEAERYDLQPVSAAPAGLIIFEVRSRAALPLQRCWKLVSEKDAEDRDVTDAPCNKRGMTAVAVGRYALTNL